MDNEPLDPLYAVVFADPENGTPDNITQAGCLMLARMGKEAWNAWRSKYPAHVGELYPVVCRNRANFKGHNFAEEAISFEKFVFDHGACFDGAQFGIAQFERAEFGNDASFCDTIFSHSANFKNAKFGDNVKFNGAKFGSNGCFLSTQFGNNASFASAKFTIGPKFSFAKFGDAASFDFTSLGESADFTEAQFGSNTKFMNVIFGDNVKFCGARFNNHEFSSTQFSYSNFGNDASFKGAQFGKNIHFDGVRFYRNSSFKGAQFGDNANFDGAQFGKNAEFIGINWEELSQLYSTYPDGLEDAKAWAKERNLSPDTFKSVSFAGATFEGWVNFSGRIFTGVTSFGRLTKPVKTIDFLSNGRCVEKELQPKGKTVEFGKAPLFHNCKLHQDSTFDGAIFPPKPSSDPIENDIAARAYRTLKLAFSQHQATHEEQRFFRLEMADEVAHAPWRKRWLFQLYECSSDYGFSLSRPFCRLWLIMFVVFLVIYICLANVTPCLLTEADCHIRFDLIQFTLLQALPLPGLDKWSDSLRSVLFPAEGWKSAIFIVSLMLHKAISMLALFLSGLALRNLFKMK